MEDKQLLLSICIPTYNRANELRIALNAFVKTIEGYENIVELIVSDNCSTDNTQEIVELDYSRFSYIKYYRNDSNLGFNRNMFSLVDVYSKGKYCWVIGDDDYVDINSIGIIVDVLNRNRELEYLSINHRVIDENEYTKFLHNENTSRNYMLTFDTYFRILDMNASDGNVLGSFMSSSIFLREAFVVYSKEIFSNNGWDNFYSTLPNAYLMATLYHKRPSAHIKQPLITIIPHEKSWDNKQYLLFSEYLPDLYEYVIKLGCNKNDLKRNNRIIIELNVILFLSKILKGEKWNFYDLKWIVKLLLSPISLLELIKKRI